MHIYIVVNNHGPWFISNIYIYTYICFDDDHYWDINGWKKMRLNQVVYRCILDNPRNGRCTIIRTIIQRRSIRAMLISKWIGVFYTSSSANDSQKRESHWWIIVIGWGQNGQMDDQRYGEFWHSISGGSKRDHGLMPPEQIQVV